MQMPAKAGAERCTRIRPVRARCRSLPRAEDNATYVIGPDDQIQVTVWGNTQALMLVRRAAGRKDLAASD